MHSNASNWGGCFMTHGSEPAFQRGAYSAPMQKAPWASRRCMLHEFLEIWEALIPESPMSPAQSSRLNSCRAVQGTMSCSKAEGSSIPNPGSTCSIPSSPMSFKALPAGALANQQGSKSLQDMGTGANVIMSSSVLLNC